MSETEHEAPLSLRRSYLERRLAEYDSMKQESPEGLSVLELRAMAHKIKGNARSFSYADLERWAIEAERELEAKLEDDNVPLDSKIIRSFARILQSLKGSQSLNVPEIQELQALNEELQSANEELQSTNEELETSNEELQSTNEELTTLNEELNVKSSEVAEVSNYLQAVHDAIDHPVIAVDENFHLLKFNNKAMSVFSLHAKMLQRNFRFFCAKDELRPICDFIEACLKRKEARRESIKIAKCHYEASGQILLDAEGKIAGVVTTLVNVTDEFSAIRQAQIARSSMFKIMEAMPVKVSVRDSQGRYTFANSTFCRTVNRRLEEVLGATDSDIFGELYGEKRRKRDFDALKTKQAVYFDEIQPRLNKNVSPRVFHTARVPFSDDGGTLNSICAVGVDITERALQEKKLIDFQSAISHVEDCFAMFEGEFENCRLTFASELLKKMASIGREDFEELEIGQLFARLAPKASESKVGSWVKKVFCSKKSEFTLEGAPRRGSKTFEVRAYSVESGDRSRVFINFQDITEERTSAQRIKEQEEEIVKASRLASLGEIAAGIAHELKTPLNTIQGYVDLIRELENKEAPFAKNVLSALGNIDRTVERISEIVGGLKNISKSSDSSGTTVVDAETVVSDVVSICSFHLKNRGVVFEHKAALDKLSVKVNKTQIAQVLINLVNNSIDAVKGCEEKRISLDVTRRGANVSFRVQDTGPGIPRAIESKIMMPFFTTKTDGTGLGLSLSKSISLAHGGDLRLCRETGSTCMELLLPVYEGI